MMADTYVNQAGRRKGLLMRNGLQLREECISKLKSRDNL
jgi:hypothetical protein